MNFNNVSSLGSFQNNGNLIQDLILSKSNPLHNLTMNETINAFGTVSSGAYNQITPNSPMSMINPQLNGPMNLPSVVPKRNTVMTKYDNKRRDTIDQIALFDWRNNTSLNNATRVPANYYQEKLTEKAKDKVRTKQMMSGYSTQYADSYDEFSKELVEKKEGYNMSEISKKDGGYILDYSEANSVVTPSYNPLLPKSSGNKPINDPSYPDERMTHNFSDRPYTTKGDRQLQARELATSQMMKERRQLQAEAEQAMYGTIKAPRQNNPNIGMGIKTQYYSDVNTDNSIRKDNGVDIEDIRDVISTKHNEGVIETTIKPKLEIGDDEGIREHYRENWQSKRDLDLYSGRSSDLTKQRSKLQQQQQIDYENLIDENRNRIFKDNYRDNIYGNIYENDYNDHNSNKREGFISSIWNEVKNIFGFSNNRENVKDNFKRKYKDEEFIEEILANPGIEYDSDIIEYNKEQNRHKYWVVKDRSKFEFEDDIKNITELIKEPISLLTDGDKIYRTMVVREVDSIKIHQREEDLESGEIKYNLINIPLDCIQNEKLMKSLSLENRHKVENGLNDRYEDVLDLDYENHILMADIMEEAPDDWKIESKIPISYHHRITLSDEDEIKSNVITNIANVDDYVRDKLKKNNDLSEYFYKEKTISGKEIINWRDGFEEHKHDLTNQLDFEYRHEAGSEMKQGIKKGIKEDPRNITKRFNEYM